MKIALISDTHGMLPQPDEFEGADLILHAGDIGPDREVEQWINQTFRPWLRTVREQMDIPFWSTLGNHDDPQYWLPHADLPFLVDDVMLYGGLKIWFSPWSPRFGSWSWMLDESRLTDKYQQIPVNTDIVVSHSPMFQALDAIGGNWCGSKALRVRMRELKPQELDKPILVCGHIHEAYGKLDLDFATIYNVASVDKYYQPKQERVVWLEI